MAKGYNREKHTCDDCGISEEERQKKPAMPTGINHPVYCETKSFYLGYDGSVRCPECHKEHELKQLFKTMDRYANEHGEDALARICGIGIQSHKS